MAITRDEVLHVARLARLALSEEEIERLTDQLGAILEAVGKVSELSTMLEAAFSEGGVHLVVVPVDYSENMRVLVNELHQVVQAK